MIKCDGLKRIRGEMDIIPVFVVVLLYIVNSKSD